jgi:HD-GYP domain-containing protein (c-di-GMP phosphodiesterase class II)
MRRDEPPRARNGASASSQPSGEPDPFGVRVHQRAGDLLRQKRRTEPSDLVGCGGILERQRMQTTGGSTVAVVSGEGSRGEEHVRAAELISALSLATDLGIGVPLEHGLQSALFATRLCDRLGVEGETARQAYYACLLFYVGCTAGAELAAETFGSDDALTRYGTPVRFGSRVEMAVGMMRAVAPPGRSVPVRALQLAHGLPRLARQFGGHVAGACEVAEMLTDRLGLPAAIGRLFVHSSERWDGKGVPGRARGNEIPVPVRIAQVARDAAFQWMLGGHESAASVVRGRAGGAFDPVVAGTLADDAADILEVDAAASVWDDNLACEPADYLTLHGEAIDRALAAMGDFSDLASSYLVGHSAGVARVAAEAAKLCRLDEADVVMVRRAAFVHDVGRVAIPVRIWNKTTPLTSDDWEQVRLHAYHSERVLSRSPFLSALGRVAAFHHERLDGTGYHRGAAAAALSGPARLLAAADAYHAMTEPRPHRGPLPPEQIVAALTDEARAGRLDGDAVAAVLAAAGEQAPPVERPAGLTYREAQVVGLLARGMQTKQVAAALGISVKTADRHVQNAYGKIGVSTRAGATLFAIQHGLLAWGELPISHSAERS